MDLNYLRDLMKVKKCLKCNKEKWLTDYYTDNSPRNQQQLPQYRLNGRPTHHYCKQCQKAARKESKVRTSLRDVKLKWVEIYQQYHCYMQDRQFDPFHPTMFTASMVTDQNITSLFQLGDMVYDIPPAFINYFNLFPPNQIPKALQAWKELARLIPAWQSSQLEVVDKLTDKHILNLLQFNCKYRRAFLRKIRCNKCAMWKFTSIEATHPQLINWVMLKSQNRCGVVHAYEFNKQKNKTRTGFLQTCNTCKGNQPLDIDYLISIHYPPAHAVWSAFRNDNGTPMVFDTDQMFTKIAPLTKHDTPINEDLVTRSEQLSQNETGADPFASIPEEFSWLSS